MGPHQPRGGDVSWHSARWGLLASAGLGLFYVLVVRGASGSWGHLADQATRDWYYLVPTVAGFGTQIALVVELRRRHHLHHGAAAAGGVGVGASTTGMVACCAHHLADLLPFIGATGAAAFLIDYRIPFLLVGIGVNALGVAVAATRLRQAPRADTHPNEEDTRCAAAA